MEAVYSSETYLSNSRAAQMQVCCWQRISNKESHILSCILLNI